MGVKDGGGLNLLRIFVMMTVFFSFIFTLRIQEKLLKDPEKIWKRGRVLLEKEKFEKKVK